MNDLPRQLTERLIAVLQDHMADGGEAALLRAYELGRSAVAGQLNTLDMLAMQQEALMQVLLQHLATEESARLTHAAAAIFAESLAPFELARRSSQEGTALLRGEVQEPASLVTLSDNLKEALQAYEKRQHISCQPHTRKFHSKQRECSTE